MILFKWQKQQKYEQKLQDWFFEELAKTKTFLDWKIDYKFIRAKNPNYKEEGDVAEFCPITAVHFSVNKEYTSQKNYGAACIDLFKDYYSWQKEIINAADGTNNKLRKKILKVLNLNEATSNY